MIDIPYLDDEDSLYGDISATDQPGVIESLDSAICPCCGLAMIDSYEKQDDTDGEYIGTTCPECDEEIEVCVSVITTYHTRAAAKTGQGFHVVSNNHFLW